MLTKVVSATSAAFWVTFWCGLTWAQPSEVKVMTFNVWSAENTAAGRDRLVDIVQVAGADIVAFQEMGNTAGQQIAADLGFHYHQQSASGTQIASRFPIVGRSADNHGALIAIHPGNFVWVFNAHLPAYPYQPYDLRDGLLPPLESAVVAAAEAARGQQIDAILNDMESPLATGYPVLLGGDFNEPSRLDWTAAAAHATDRPFDLKIDFPTSAKILQRGLADSFRSLRTDEVTDRGYTWTPGYPPPNLNSNEVHDRIDLLYHRGDRIQPVVAQTVGLSDLNPNTDIGVPGFNSDHRAVVIQYALQPPKGSSILRFSGLTHNPGNDTALNGGDYGDRWCTTPHIELQYLASAGSHFDTYDGDYDHNGANNWNGGVAQLQSASGGRTFDVRFLPDDGFGVVVQSFDLVDYVGFATGHTVSWQLWAGQPDGGNLIASGQEMVEADSIRTMATGQTEFEYRDVTLRLRQLAGDGTDLAIDNVQFRQAAFHRAQAITASYGILVSGDLEMTFESDDTYLKYRSATSFPDQTPLQLVCESDVTPEAQSLRMRFEGSASTIGLAASVEWYNWNTGVFEAVASEDISLEQDRVTVVEVSNRVADFIRASDGHVRTRIGISPQNPTIGFPWTLCLDQIIWTTE